VNGEVDASGLKHDKIDPKALVQTLQGGVQWILGPQSGSFTMKLYLPGHGAATTGSVTVDAMETFYGFIFGNATPTATAGDTATGTGTASTPHTTGANGFVAGGLLRGGIGGTSADGRGNGQGSVVSTHAANVLTLLVAFDGALSAADALKPCVNLYLPEDPNDATAAVASFRCELLSANYRYRCHGCFVSGVKFSGGNAGELPSLDVTVTVSWWEYSVATAAFPSSVTSNRYNPAPTAGGSLFLAPVGTATRDTTSKRNIRSLSIDIGLGVAPLMGLNGVSQYQTIVGAVRVPSPIKWSWTEDSGAASDTPELDGFFTGSTAYHILATLGPVDGKSVCVYSPNICYSGPRPTQKNVNRVNRTSIEAMAYTGGDTTSQLSQSAIRFGLS
jgi:hypothetical protein